MPAWFRTVNREAELWAPFRLNPSIDYRAVSGRFLHSVARLKSGVTIDEARTEMNGIAAVSSSSIPSSTRAGEPP
jgi:hypothetical protein